MHLAAGRSIILLALVAIVAVLSYSSRVHVGRIVAAVALHTTQTGSLSSLAVVGSLAIDVLVARYVLFTEVEHQGGVQSHTAETSLEVQV